MQNQQSSFVRVVHVARTWLCLLPFLFFILTEIFYVKTRDHFVFCTRIRPIFYCNLVDPPASGTDTNGEPTSQENRTSQFETETHTKESAVEEAEDALNAINVVILCVFFTEVKYSWYYAAYWEIHIGRFTWTSMLRTRNPGNFTQTKMCIDCF